MMGARNADQLRARAEQLEQVAGDVRDFAERKACWAMILLGTAGLVALRARARRDEALEAHLDERQAEGADAAPDKVPPITHERVADGLRRYAERNGATPAPAVEADVDQAATE